MFKRILVPVDLTEKALKAVDAAHALARQSGGAVTLLHVIETIEHIQMDELKPFYERLERSAVQGLREFAERFEADDLRIEQAVIYGHRMDAIIDYAVEQQMDLVVMASHRIDPDRPGHDWSSLSYGVAILSPCPVLLVK